MPSTPPSSAGATRFAPCWSSTACRWSTPGETARERASLAAHGGLRLYSARAGKLRSRDPQALARADAAGEDGGGRAAGPAARTCRARRAGDGVHALLRPGERLGDGARTEALRLVQLRRLPRP